MPSPLSPGDVARRLFTIDKDRDERASQLCTETLLTLAANGYAAPSELPGLRSPKEGRFALRCLAIGTNFLAGDDEPAVGADLSRSELGNRLAIGDDLLASDNLHLAKAALEGLIDPDTRRGQRGTFLLFPFHESLLWYDARQRKGREWATQQVLMRGSGITLARLLCDPPSTAPDAAAHGKAALTALRSALTAPGPLADVARALQLALGDKPSAPATREEEQAWTTGGQEELTALARDVCRHAAAVMEQSGASPPARLWQLRHLLALDLSTHLLRTAWDASSAPQNSRYLLLAFSNQSRPDDLVRQRSEDSYRRARITISEAIIATLAEEMHRKLQDGTSWEEALGKGNPLAKKRHKENADVWQALETARSSEDFHQVARQAYERVSYDRAAGDGFRVLIQSIGMTAGSGSYQYFTAGPDLLAALVGGLADRMPMTFGDFSQAVFDEWHLVIGDEPYPATDLVGRLDSDELTRNGRRVEQILIEAGLAVGLSDRTTMVGERAAGA